MKTRLSIAVAALAVAGVAFVGLAPREARADLAKVKKALQSVKTMKVEMTRFNPKGKPEMKELWFENEEWEEIKPDEDGVLRIDTTQGQFEGAVIEVVGEPMMPSEFFFDKLANSNLDWIFDQKDLIEVHPNVFVVKGFETEVELVEGDRAEVVEVKGVLLLDDEFVLQNKKNSSFKTVVDYDQKTNLPKHATRFKKVGEKWETSAELKFTFNKPMPKKK